MSVEIRHEDHRALATYAGISCAYDVRAVIEPLSPGTPTALLERIVVDPPFRKDYDAIPGNHPSDWPARFAVHRARFLGAYSNERRVGSAVVIVEPTDIIRLGGASGMALLWDLRVAPAARGHGVGRALLNTAETDARDAGFAGMGIETQNVNAIACDLYRRAGYVISRVDANVYVQLPNEIQVIWAKTFELLSPSG